MLPANYATIPGWCTHEKAYALMNLVKDAKANLSVELGVFGGRSLLAIAIASKKENPNSKVVGIDAWEKQASLEGTNDKANDDWWANINYEEFYRHTKILMQQNNVDSIVDLWKCKSRDAASKFEDNSIDLLHQDSNHSEEISCEEVELYCNKVKPGSYWVFDDTDWPTTKKAQSLLLSKGYRVLQVASDNKWTVFQRLN
jgi:predicted O-methyltransferase YrrM